MCVEVAQSLTGHARTETTRPYDRRDEHISLDEFKRIGSYDQRKEQGP